VDLMQLEDFFDYKNQLMEDILTNDTLVDLLEDIDIVRDPKDLAYTRVFPCEYVPSTVEEGKTFICFDVDVQSVSNKTFLNPVLYIWVFTHKSKLRLPEGGVRTDKICSEICKMINGSRKYTIGELNLFAIKRFAPMTDFQGKMMTFVGKEFNRQYDGTKYTPENRKRG